MKENITSIVTNILYSLHIHYFMPNCVFLQSILYLYFYIYFMGHKENILKIN